MIRILTRLVFTIGLLSIACIVYVSSFYLVSYKLVRPHEHNQLMKSHPIRPVYNRVYYPMRWFVANGLSIRKNMPETYYGTLEKLKNYNDREDNGRTARISTLNNSSIQIGFIGKESVLSEFDRIKSGSYVKMVFGVTLAKNRDKFINRLLQVQVIDLMPDPRIEDEDLTDEEVERIEKAFNALSGEAEACVTKFVEDYESQVMAHCRQSGYAQNIGGGCDHVLGYSITMTVIKRALQHCGQAH